MVGKLDITITLKADHSILKDAYATQPFKIVPINKYDDDQALYLMVMNSSPGILSGDEYHINISIEKNARLQLQSQAYQRLFNMENFATQHTQITLQENSCLAYVPHPIVPHEKSTFYATNHIDMENNCTLILGEIITSGRKLFGESFKFNLFQNRVEVYYRQKLIFKDNVLLQPSIMNMNTMGMLEEYSHQGSLFFINTSNTSCIEAINHIHQESQKLTDVAIGISTLQANGFIVRILGNSGEQLFDFFQETKNFLWYWKAIF